MVDQAFERYFHARAELADELVAAGYGIEGCGLATAGLDALGAIWFHDFPAAERELGRASGGAVPSGTRMARLMQRFAPGEHLASRVAVVCFAEDWQRYAPATASPAEALLERRLGTMRGELPHAHEDKSIDDLLSECPAINTQPQVRALLDEYLYPAILYRFYRCPMLHVLGRARRTHGFTVGEEVMYMPLHAGFTSISFGPRLITRWLRAATSGYVRACAQAGLRPATDIDPGADGEDRLRARWERLRT